MFVYSKEIIKDSGVFHFILKVKVQGTGGVSVAADGGRGETIASSRGPHDWSKRIRGAART